MAGRYDLACEKALFLEFFPPLRGKRLLKTDLWDEAKNTLILKWAADKGAQVYGLDISSSILREALGHFGRDQGGSRFVLADLRQTPFGDNSFDLLYSMGTVEHFPEFRQALEECHRVLKPGGRAIIGVPNKCDPFLRPLLVWLLTRLSLYAYGLEKSFSLRELEVLLRETEFEVQGRTGILNPGSPYQKLLAQAGCEFEDIARLVEEDGVEGALERLLQAGVYLTVEEFKGRRPALGSGQAIPVSPSWTSAGNSSRKSFSTTSPGRWPHPCRARGCGRPPSGTTSSRLMRSRECWKPTWSCPESGSRTSGGLSAGAFG